MQKRKEGRLMELENFRYYKDTEGYEFVLISSEGYGIIVDPDGLIQEGYTNPKITQQLQEIDPSYFTSDFLEKFVEMNLDSKIRGITSEDIAIKIKEDVEHQKKKCKCTCQIPNSVLDAIDKRISEIHNELNGRNGVKTLTKELNELVDFKRRLRDTSRV